MSWFAIEIMGCNCYVFVHCPLETYIAILSEDSLGYVCMCLNEYINMYLVNVT